MGGEKVSVVVFMMKEEEVIKCQVGLCHIFGHHVT